MDLNMKICHPYENETDWITGVLQEERVEPCLQKGGESSWEWRCTYGGHSFTFPLPRTKVREADPSVPDQRESLRQYVIEKVRKEKRLIDQR